MVNPLLFLIDDPAGGWFQHIAEAAKRAGVEPEVIARFKAGQWKEHDALGTHTLITKEAWSEMMDALHERGIRAVDLLAE